MSIVPGNTALLRQCPKWDSCNVPVCPLDAHWRKATQLHGEGACRWLREIGKQGGEARISPVLPREVYEKVSQAHRELASEAERETADVGTRRYELIGCLRRAWRSGSQLESGRKLKAKQLQQREASHGL